MRPSALPVLFLLLCCGGLPPTLTDSGTPVADAGAQPDAGAPDAGGTCGPRELCMRTRLECNQSLTQLACEGFYANAANCRDMAAYTACNCGCITEPTCSDYFACGNLCFNDHCR